MTHIVPVHTRTRHELFLFFHLMWENMTAYAFSFPIVPKGQSRVRLVFHAHNTKEQVAALATAICDWAREMLEIERGETDNALPSATRRVYAWQSS
jgi:8-amino-7-oxononanoate synthase